MAPRNLTVSTRITIASGIIFGTLGFAANWLNPSLFFGVNIFFGSFFVMLALFRYGTGAGVLAAALAASYALIFWHSPLGVLVWVGEALVVGRMLRRSRNIAFLDTLYWFCLGMPFYLLYHVASQTDLPLAVLLTLKHGVNGIFNALAAALLLHLANLSQPFRRPGEQPTHFHHLLATSMVAAILIPGICYVVLEIRRDISQEEQRIHQRLQTTTNLTRQMIETWLADKTHDVQTLASQVGDPQTTPAAIIQNTANLTKLLSPHFVKMSVQNSRAISVAFVPAVDEQGRSNVGRDYSTMPYHRIVRETLRPAVSDIDYGTVSKVPRLALFAPIVIDGEFRGYCTGTVEIARMTEQLRIIAGNRVMDITLLDRKRQVIASTDSARKMMERFDPGMGKERRRLSDGLYQFIPLTPRGNNLQRWQQASFGMDSPLNADVPWSIVITTPMKPFLEGLENNASRGFALLLALILFSIATAHVASAAFTRPIAHLEQISATLPADVIRHQEIDWPHSGIREVAGLIGNVRQMAATLQGYVHELQTINESLEQRVVERTEDIRRLNEELEERVNERTAQLKSALLHMESFSYSISHDLRAPLRAVNGYATILLEDFAPHLPAEAQRYLGQIAGNGIRMAALIDDLLTFSRLSRHPLKRENVDPAAVVRDVLEELEGERAGRTVQVTVGDLPPCQADPSLIRQVFANLLSNAFKYSRKREDTRIEVGSFKKDGATVYFVRDNGDGFDMAYADKLFGVFQRLHRSEDFEGTGVGLAIVHNIVTRHGGTVWAESAAGKGATFFFTLAEG
ncbi:sensor histidine kinase [Geobacter grbiciae]|uniref:sensor histidine kinase n=1 Tax=Geobacter grbiciae TaxID=155042 RepID=UPI001C022EF2|nr:sensor histidine kinase [Geobacter grbiciae]MBT1074047.1 histidine kinase [Geobacter grbiciae]